MLLFISLARFRRSVLSFSPPLANAFLTHAPRTSAAASAANRFCRGSLSSPRFMNADALAGEKTEEEKAAIKAAREARKYVHAYDYCRKVQMRNIIICRSQMQCFSFPCIMSTQGLKMNAKMQKKWPRKRHLQRPRRKRTI